MNVADLARGAAHDAGEDRHLMGHQECGEGDPEDDAEVLAPVAGEHFPRDPAHDDSFRRCRARLRTAARLNSWMCSPSVSTSSCSNSISPARARMTGRAKR